MKTETQPHELSRADRAALEQFSESTRALLSGLLLSSDAAEIAGRSDQDAADKRKKLLQRRDVLLQKAAVARDDKAAQRRCDEAAQAVVAAEAELKRRQEQLQDVRRECQVPADTLEREAKDIDAALRSAMDRRLVDFRNELTKVIDSTVERHEPVMTEEITWFGRRRQVLTWNTTEVKAAQQAIKEIHRQSHEVAMGTLTFKETTQQMLDWCAELAPSLAVLKLNPPHVNAKTGEVSHARPYAGAATATTEAKAG